MTTVFAAKGNAAIQLETLKDPTVIVSIPAAFSGTCTEQCVPGILSALPRIKKAGAKRVIIVCSDQPHAINEWVRYSKWAEADVEFASDFGSFQLRKIVGMLSEEEGKTDLPQSVGNLLRRAYLIVKGGRIVWKYVEPDTRKYTLDVEELIRELKRA